MRAIFLPAMLACVWAAATAAGPILAQGLDVPDWARDEVMRRGNKVEHVQGGFENGQEPPDVWGAPADDSGKWHLVIFTARGDAASAYLLEDLHKSAELRAFVNLDDHKASWAACNVYRSDDGSQSWRMRLYQRHLAEGFPGVRWQYPMVIVQPPRRGNWGDARRIVGVRSGYDGDETKLSQWLRATIEGYCEKVREHSPAPPASAPPPPPGDGAGTVKGPAGGPLGEPVIGGPAVGGHGQAPFPVPPRLDDGGGGIQPGPIEFPPSRRGASIGELQAAIPGVDAEFLLQQVSAKATLQEALQAWQLRLLQKQTEELRKKQEEAAKAEAAAKEAAAKAEAAAKEAAAKEAAKAEAAVKGVEKPPAAAPSAAEPVSWSTILLGALVILSTVRTIRQQMGVPTIVPDDWWKRGVEIVQSLMTKPSQARSGEPSGGSGTS